MSARLARDETSLAWNPYPLYAVSNS